MNILQIYSDYTEVFNTIQYNSIFKDNSQLPPTLSYKTNEMLSSVKTTDNDILKINAKLDPNKAHGHNKINIHMIKICTFFGSH